MAAFFLHSRQDVCMKSDFSDLLNRIKGSSEDIVCWQNEMTACQAIAPENGGDGEAQKITLIETWLKDLVVSEFLRFDSPDPRVSSGIRPNLLVRSAGKSSKTLWLFAHLDVVPAGDPAAWQSDPWIVRRDGDNLYGRGVEDNQQAIASMLALLSALSKEDYLSELSLGLVFMADEENGSKHGLEYVLDHAGELFGPEDLYVVPDAGSANADVIEVAEKGQLWLRFAIRGRQCHASSPQKGCNALLGGAALIIALSQQLPRLFPGQNMLFKPPISTFAPTRQDANNVAINIVPGADIFYMDCRLLPEIAMNDVVNASHEIARMISREYGVGIETESVHMQEPTSIPHDCIAVQKLKKAVESVYGVVPRPIGIGGATIASFLRRRNLPAVVWACLNNTCHQPNENSSIKSTIGDAMVFAHMLENGHSGL